MDVHAELMKVATAAVKQTATGQPSAPSQGNGKLEPAPAAGASGAAPSGTEVAAAEGRDPKAKDETKPGDAAEEPPPFNDHPRWKKVTGQLADVTRERDDLRVPAEQYGKVLEYMDTFGITTDDMVVAYDLIARMKTDPFSALERLTPIYEELQRRAGATLPDDLAKRVDEGYLDENSARELAQARVRAKLSDDAAARATTRVEQTHVGTMVERNRGAAASWEAQVIAKDPDFERKRPAVQDAAKAILAAEGQPRTPEDAVKVLERAYARVNHFVNGYAPKPSATPRTPSSAASSSTSVAPPPPKTLREAAAQGLTGTYRFTS